MRLGNKIGIQFGSRSSPAPVIEITTTIPGDFSIILAGTGDVVITWPDLSTDTVVLADMGDVVTTKALTGGGDITISNLTVLTNVSCGGMAITACVIPASCVNLQYLYLDDNSLTTFIAHAEWANLQYLCLDRNSLTTFIAHAEWVNLQYLYLDDNSLTTFIAHAEWVNLQYLYLYGNSLTTFIAHAEWVNLQYLSLDDNSLTESAVNAILVELDTITGLTEAEILLNYGTNATPTGAGITAYDSLTTDGNTVICNGYPV
jgi:Leucine-rich repeat (LRR) protein